MRLKQLKKEKFKKTAEPTGDLIGNKIANRITKVLINWQRNNSDTYTNENDTEIPKQIYIHHQKKEK